MHLLVTGHRGYIGRAVCEYLNERGYDYMGLDLPEYDIRDPASVESVFKHRDPFDAVIHLAAAVSVADCEADPTLCYETNLTGTANLLASACRNNCRRFIQASSIAADTPAGNYGISKAAAEQVASAYGVAADFPTVSLRLCNVAGGRHASRTHLMPNIIRAAKEGKPFQFTGEPSSSRDYVHVSEVARAFVHFAETALPTDNYVIDIGTGHASSITDVFAVFAHRLRERFGIELTAEPFSYENQRPGESYELKANTEQAAAFGWTPSMMLSDIIDHVLTEADLG